MKCEFTPYYNNDPTPSVGGARCSALLNKTFPSFLSICWVTSIARYKACISKENFFFKQYTGLFATVCFSRLDVEFSVCDLTSDFSELGQCKEERKERNALCNRKEGNILFNDALNTFYLQLYGVRHMVKDHSDSERGNLLPPHELLFLINSKGSFICIIPHTG